MKQRLTISSLYKGMSQQPPWRQQTGQVEEALNFTLDPLEGARKRNPTLYYDVMGIDPAVTYHFAQMRNFVFAIGGGVIHWKNLETGYGATVVALDGWGYLAGATADSIDTTTAVDTLIVLNRNVIPQTEHTPRYARAGTVDVFSELPDDATEGQIYRVLISENHDPAGHYMRINPGNPVIPDGFKLGPIHGNWMRVPAPNQPQARYTASTMPHRITYDSTNNRMLFEQCNWQDRLSGTYHTSKRMPWVNVGLRSVCFHSGRLFLLGYDNITSGGSSPNQSVFNLYPEDINDITDSDRIAIDIVSSNVGRVQRSLSIGNDLLICCENGQLVFSSGDEVLSSINGRYRQIGDIRSPDKPLATNGGEIALTDEYKRLHLFKWEDLTRGVMYKGSLSEHVPNLITENIDRLYYINDTIFIATDSTTVYVHERLGVDGEILSTAWSKFTFPVRTYFMSQWKEWIYLYQKSVRYEVNKYKHKRQPVEQSFDNIRLDRMKWTTPDGYNTQTNETRFNMGDRDFYGPTTSMLVVDQSFVAHPVERVEGTYVYVKGNIPLPCRCGYPIDARLKLSKIYAGQSDVRLPLSRVVVGYRDSSSFNVEIGRTGSTKIQTYPGIRTDLYTLGASQQQSGTSRFIAAGDAKTTEITIRSNDAGTVTVDFVELQLVPGDN